MDKKSQNLWPYSSRAALLSVFGILAVLTLVVLIARVATDWPSESNEGVVLLGILILSLIPLLLLLIDMLVSNRAVLEYKGIKLDFSGTSPARLSTTTVPTNIGVPSKPVPDSSSTEILDALRNAVKNEVVVLDLEEGQAWWETRLLVLLSGAVRLGRPRVVVFLATEGGKTDMFQGWGYVADLHRAILRSDPQYQLTYHAVKAASSQWEHLEPPSLGNAPLPMSGLASQYSWMAFKNDLPNTFAAEQLLASELSGKIESPGLHKVISTVRLNDLFAAVLRRDSVNQSSSPEDQLKQFASDDADYVAVTRDGKYVQMMRRLTVLSAMVSSLAGKQEA
ncbi:MAG: hypothetical protein L0332_18420 [Chloroflexi bacterium]|nr:hypothetical protein [Chloroflexota bacterium]MCI0643444.1 hypothetical protein [Chloroflexota bacterium]MCI0728676.1 hypothetical protein [Chloroflexota bacterium]